MSLPSAFRRGVGGEVFQPRIVSRKARKEAKAQSFCHEDTAQRITKVALPSAFRRGVGGEVFLTTNFFTAENRSE